MKGYATVQDGRWTPVGVEGSSRDESSAPLGLNRPKSFFDRRQAIQGSGLDCKAAIVLEQIADAGETCYLSLDQLAERCCMARRTLQSRLNQLRDAGLIIKLRFDGRRTEYVVDWGKLVGENGAAGAPNRRGSHAKTAHQVRRIGAAGAQKWHSALDSKNAPIKRPQESPPTNREPTQPPPTSTPLAKATLLADRWYDETQRRRPASSDENHRLAHLIELHGERAVTQAVSKSIAYVRSPKGWPACQSLGGIINRIDEWSLAIREEAAQEAEKGRKRAVEAAEREARERTDAENWERYRAYWVGLSEEERREKLQAARDRYFFDLPDDWYETVAMEDAYRARAGDGA